MDAATLALEQPMLPSPHRSAASRLRFFCASSRYKPTNSATVAAPFRKHLDPLANRVGVPGQCSGYRHVRRRARVVCGCSLEKSMQSGERSFDCAYQQALSEVPISGDEKNQNGRFDRAVLRDQIRYLEEANAKLLEQIGLPRVENEQQKSAATALDDALKRERKRAEAAEADTLRKQLD